MASPDAREIVITWCAEHNACAASIVSVSCVVIGPGIS